MKNTIFWEAAAYFTANIVPTSLIHVTLMMEAIHSSKMLILTGATRHIFSEDSILQSYCVKISILNI
jgi:hypothetical protein